MSSPSITLYTCQTPNGIKISITLAELDLPYNVYNIDTHTKEQKAPWFLDINPNGRIPAITDIHRDDGQEIRVFESGSIMQYLVERYDTEYRISYPRGSREWVEMNSWVFFLNAGVGPSTTFESFLSPGQANHFFRYCTEHSPYAIQRYQDETRRLYGVLDKHLHDSGTDYLVGNKCTIADIATWPWVTLARWSLGGEHHPVSPLDEFPALKAWEERMFGREGVEKGRHVPEPHQREMLRDPVKMEAFEERGREFYKKTADEKEEAAKANE